MRESGERGRKSKRVWREREEERESMEREGGRVRESGERERGRKSERVWREREEE